MNQTITWNTVAEETPFNNQRVLVALSGSPLTFEATYNERDQTFDYPYYGQTSVYSFENVTHWAPMPRSLFQ